jgi:hypothetical protein
VVEIAMFDVSAVQDIKSLISAKLKVTHVRSGEAEPSSVTTRPSHHSEAAYPFRITIGRIDR